MEPNVDIVVGHSMVTSWSIELLLLDQSNSLTHICSVCNEFMSALFYTNLSKDRKIDQDSVCAMLNACQHSMHTIIDSPSLLGVFVSIFPNYLLCTSTFRSLFSILRNVTFSFFNFIQCHFHVIFTMECVTFTFAHILEVSFMLLTSYNKFHIL